MPKIKIDRDEAEIRYSNWISMLIDLLEPKNLYLYGGRGVAKTTDIIAKRSIRVIEDLPGGVFSFIADTYINAITNIVPNVLEGWERNKFFEKIHFVIDERAPNAWLRNKTIKLQDWKRTITTYNGCVFLIKSLDRPSMNAGISVIHRFGDEAKYLAEEKLKKTTPTLRGDILRFEHSPFFRGNTFCSDVANPADGEYDWMDSMKSLMDPEIIFNTLQAALFVNDLRWKLYIAHQKNDVNAINNLKVTLDRWESRLRKIRKVATFFYVVSSLANIDILTFQYILDMKDSLSFEEFKTAILSCKPSVEKGMRFYPILSEHHFYSDGYDYDYYDQFGIKDNISQNCEGLNKKHYDKDKALEGGYDAGNMHSLVIDQDFGDVIKFIKNFHVLAPDWIDKLGREFVLFFKTHRHKVLDLYYDRAANNYQRQGKDMATQLKNAIEKDDKGNNTGWTVNLMSIGQSDITHQEEYDLAQIMMGEKNRRLPKILIDKYNCKELKSSLELAKAKMTVDSKGKKVLKKVKTSEKIAILKLPMQSTNYSDAFKYSICRKRFMNIVKNKSSESF